MKRGMEPFLVLNRTISSKSVDSSARGVNSLAELLLTQVINLLYVSAKCVLE